MQCFFPILKSLQFGISGGERIINCCAGTNSQLVLTHVGSHERRPEEQLLREGEPGSALYRGVRDKGDGPVIRAVRWVRLVTQRAPCREGKGMKKMKRPPWCDQLPAGMF